MLEQAGSVVTREELRKRLWAEDTFVNFDKSLNTAINTLREALGDNPNQPAYIQTVPRHGYRFIAAVTTSRSGPDQSLTAPIVHPHMRRVHSIVWTSAFIAIVISILLIWLALRHRTDKENVKVTPVATFPGLVRSPSLSPDGSHVAFSWRPEGASHYSIYVQGIGAAEPLQLTRSEYDDMGPAWSPDGSQIAFIRTAQAQPSQDLKYSDFNIVSVPPTGGEPRQITTIHSVQSYGAYQGELLAWMPDGKSLLFPASAGGERTAIWKVDIRTADRIQLTHPESPVLGHTLPSVRPDGAVLAYQRLGGPCFSALVAVALDPEGKPTGSTNVITCERSVAPIGWIGNDLLFSSRSSQRTFFQRWTPSGKISNFEIPDVDAMPARISVVSGSITRDGHRIAIGLFRWNVHLWKADISQTGKGEHARPFITSTFRDLNADYSPDGSRIVFKSTRSGSDDAWLAWRDGTHLQRLTYTGSVGYPRWSPDGKAIVLNGGTAAHGNLFVVHPESGGSRQLTHGLSNDENARWSPDGRLVYFNSDRSGQPEIWKVPPTGGAEIQVTHSGGSNPMVSPDGRFLYFGRASGGPAFVWRMSLSSAEEHKLFPAEINTQSLAVGKRHIYFVRKGQTIYSYDLQDGKITEVLHGEIRVGSPAPSPDEKELVYSVIDHASGDILILDRAAR